VFMPLSALRPANERAGVSRRSGDCSCDDISRR
jgi:hypothetical protein